MLFSRENQARLQACGHLNVRACSVVNEIDIERGT